MVSTAFLFRRRKLRHSLGRPSRSDFVQFKFAHMCKKNIKKETIESINEIDLSQVVSYEKYEDIEMEYDMQVKRQSMTKNQKAILDYILLGYSDREISEELGISRQYINRIKKDFV